MRVNILEKLYNKFPNGMTIKSDKKVSNLKWLGQNISSPENRLIMGITALSTQPFIDLYNKDVDNETKKASCARTAAKILAGTITGVSIRYATIATVKRLSKLPGENIKAFEKIFTPKAADKKLINSSIVNKNMYEDYQKTLGTILGLVAMLYTNFAWDVPLTKFFAEKISKKLNDNPTGGEKIASK